MMRRFATGLVMLLLAGAAYGQSSPDGVWTALSESDLAAYERAAQSRERGPLPLRYRAFRLNEALFAQVAAAAPIERLDLPLDQRPAPATISIPMPDGSFTAFAFVETFVMHPDLAVNYPSIRTYVGHAVDEPATGIRFSLTPHGFSAYIFGTDGSASIEPALGNSVYIAYSLQDSDPEAAALNCLTESVAPMTRSMAQAVVSAGTELRTFRLAVACTGEYAQYHGGTVEHALAAVVASVNTVNGIFERDLAVRFVLVADNDMLMFTNGSTDPYTNEDLLAMLGQNQSTITNIIGVENYDVGHVFATPGGGLARLWSVCDDSIKAWGATSRMDPVGLDFNLVFAHELGHQFGASHTFNGVDGSCETNIMPEGAYEPGSGSTIMAYPGNCLTDNVVIFRESYFHGFSIEQMLTFIEEFGSCAAVTPTGNGIPSVNAGANFTIPGSTPFTLTGSASDSTRSQLTYTWEQFDLGPQSPLDAPDDGLIPLFRSRPPETSRSRDFPHMSVLLSNFTDPSEKLPTTARTMKFRLTVRDNVPGGGGVNSDETTLVVDPTKGPFMLTYPNGGEQLPAGGTITVTWDPAGTNLAPVSANFVHIRLFTDGGELFTTLAGSVPNNGSRSVTLPDVYAPNARILVSAAGNVFFDVSDGNFQVGTADTTTFTSSDVPQAIPDSGLITSTIHIPTAMRIEDVDVTLNVSHTYVSDLVFTLTSPQDETITLIDRAGDHGDNFHNTTLDDEASTSINDGSASFPGRYRPVQPLSTYDTQNARGTWTLTIEDTVPFDSGTLNGWELTITSRDVVGLRSTVYVDFDHVGEETGSFSFPFNTIAEALVKVADDGEIRIAPGTSPETLVINQSVTLTNTGAQPVRIGATP